jgi:hypothetical protein
MMTRDEIVAELVKRKTPADQAVQYADAFMEYQTASANIEKSGAVCSHPRTGAPMLNPYLPIRDGALKKLQNMRNVKADFLWAAGSGM